MLVTHGTSLCGQSTGNGRTGCTVTSIDSATREFRALHFAETERQILELVRCPDVSAATRAQAFVILGATYYFHFVGDPQRAESLAVAQFREAFWEEPDFDGSPPIRDDRLAQLLASARTTVLGELAALTENASSSPPAGILALHDALPERASFSADRGLLCIQSGPNSALLWDFAGAEALRSISSEGRSVTALALSPDGVYLALAAEHIRPWLHGPRRKGGIVTIFNTESGRPTARRYTDDIIDQLSISNGGRIVILGSTRDRFIEICKWQGDSCVASNTFPSPRTTALAMDAAGNLFVKGDADGTLHYGALSGAEREQRVFPDTILALLFSPDGGRLACRGRETVVVLNTGTWKECTRAALPINADVPSVKTSMAFCPGGEALLCVYDDSTRRLCLVDAGTGARHDLTTADSNFDEPPAGVGIGSQGELLYAWTEHRRVTIPAEELLDEALPTGPVVLQYRASLRPDSSVADCLDLTFSLWNAGAGTGTYVSRNLRLFSESVSQPRVRLPALWLMSPGDTATASLRVKLTGPLSRIIRGRVYVTEAHGFGIARPCPVAAYPPPVGLIADIGPPPPPPPETLLVLDGYKLKDNDGDGRMERGEVITIATSLKNLGCDVQECAVCIHLDDETGVFLAGENAQPSQPIGPIAAGETKSCIFGVFANSSVSEIRCKLYVTCGGHSRGTSTEVEIPLVANNFR